MSAANAQSPSEGQGATPRSATPSTAKDRRITGKQILAAVLVVLAIVFMLENTRTVTVRVIVPDVRMPLFLALLACVVLGALATFLLTWQRKRGGEKGRGKGRR